MTTREFYVAIASAQNLDAELVEKANELIAALNHKNELRKSKPSKASQEAAERKVAVLNALGFETLMNRTEVAAEVGCTEGQATAALTALVRDGLVEKFEAKGKGGKTTYHRILVED